MSFNNVDIHAIVVEAVRNKKGAYYKTSDGEIFWLEPIDERAQVEKDLGEILTEEQKIVRIHSDALPILNALKKAASTKAVKEDPNLSYYSYNIDRYLEELKDKELTPQKFKNIITIYNLFALANHIPGGKIEVPKYLLLSDSYHDWTGRVFWFDDKKLELHYFDQSGQKKIMSLVDMMPIEERDILRVLEIPFHYKSYDLDKLSSSPEYAEWKEKQNKGYVLPLYAYNDDPILKKEIDDAAKDNEIRGWGSITELKSAGLTKNAVDTVFKTEYIAPFIAQDYAADYKKIKSAVEKQKKDLMETTPDECPKIPNLRADLQYFPHQAKTLAVLNKTNEGVIDMDMGGGKTITLLSDALNMLASKRAKRPLIVLPNNTMAQQKDEMSSFTDDTINFFCINTFTTNALKAHANDKTKSDLDVLKEEIDKLPPNTIFLASYEWLSRGYELRDFGFKNRAGKALLQKDFLRSRWLLDSIGIDYVAIDESHRIKNPNSSTAQSILALAKAKIRRIATGTLIPNNPMDIVTQMAFINPTVFGSIQNVIDEYAEEVGRAGVVVKWADDAPKKMRKKLLEHGAVSVRRSHWMHMLPEREEVVHKVQLTDAQQKVYEAVINDILKEIQDDPALAELWQKFQESEDNDDDSEEFGPLLAKLVRLDSFLCAPESQLKFIQQLSGKDKVSPKVAKIDEILTEHFSDPKNGKAIVFVQNLASAHAIIKHSKHQSSMIYYDASVKENVQKFKDDDSIKVLVAVDKSLREGHNLQIANCVIRADIHWSPGAMEQSYGRVFRPKQRRKVKIHIIVTDNTAEVTKYARLVSKAHVNRKINSDFDDNYNLTIIKMNLGSMTNFRKFDLLKDYIARSEDILTKEKEESVEIAKKYGSSMVDIPRAKAIQGDKVLTPYVPGSNAKYPITIQPYKQKGKIWYLIEDKQSIYVLDNRDARDYKFRWFNNAGNGGWWFGDKTEVLNGVEEKTWIETMFNLGYDVTIKDVIDEDGDDATVDDSGKVKNEESEDSGERIILTEKMVDQVPNDCECMLCEKKIKIGSPIWFDSEGAPFCSKKHLDSYNPDKDEEDNKAPDKAIELYLVDFDNHITLGIPKDDDDADDFKKFGFKWKHQYFWRMIKTKQEAIQIIDLIETKLNLEIQNRDSLIKSILNHKILTGPNVSVTKKQVKEGKPDGVVDVKFTLIDGYPFLTVPWTEASQELNSLKSLKFKWEPAHYWLSLPGGKSGINAVVKKILDAGYTITNWSVFSKACKKQGVALSVSPGDK